MTPAGEIERLAVLVHEVRSPVAALSAIAETFADEDLGGPARLELSHLAIAASRGIERVVIDAATTSLRLERVDIGALVRQAVSAARLAGARAQTEIAADLPLIAADPVRLRQALDNLVANALTHGGSDATIVVKVAPGETSILVSVADTGPGVPLVDQQRIFETGVRLDSRRPGSGLGLAITSAIAAAHGGEVTLTSTPGKGATFTIVLPLRGS
ncbi:MAG: sensor histidine kinase [Gaiellaceae bacterium]